MAAGVSIGRHMYLEQVMGFKEAVRTCLREKYFTISGRAARSEYWYFTLFAWLFFVVGALIAGGVMMAFSGVALDGTGNIVNAGFPALVWVVFVILGLAGLGLYIPMLTVMVRRFHDRNLSGWWVLGVAIGSNLPYIGVLIGIAALVITVMKGTEGPNRYGDDPLNPTTAASVFA